MPSSHRPPRIRVAGLVLDDDGRVLLVRQGRSGRSRWMLPGGGVEGGEAMADAVTREMAEETGLTSIRVGDPVAMVESISPPEANFSRHVVHVVFHVTATTEQMRQVRATDPDVLEVRWFDRAELMSVPIHPPMAGFLAWWRPGGSFGWLGKLWAP